MIKVTSVDPVIGTNELTKDDIMYVDTHWSEIDGIRFVGNRSDLERASLPVLEPVKVGDRFYGVTVQVHWSGMVEFWFHAADKENTLHLAKALATQKKLITTVTHLARILVRFDRDGSRVGEVDTLDRFYENLDPKQLDYSTFTGDMIPT